MQAWLERELLLTAIAPLAEVLACLIIAIAILLLAATELVLCFVAPISLFFGIESRKWHKDVLQLVINILNGEKSRHDD